MKNGGGSVPVTRAQVTFSKIPTGVGGYIHVNPPLGTPNTLTATQSLIYAQPWYVPNGIAIEEVGVNLAGSVASTFVRQGFYADNGSYYPGSLVYDVGLSNGTISATQSAGYYTIILPVPIFLGPGIYWAAIVSQGGAASLRGQNTGLDYLLSSTQALASLSQPAWGSYTQASVTGALPQTFTTTRTVNTSAAPQFLVRIQ